MCGIFGFAKSEMLLDKSGQLKLQGAIMDLAVLNESRGRDGTGLFIASASSAALFKEAKPASELLQTKRLRDTIKKISGDTLIVLGHTRLATVGAVSSENCHPFVSENFAGVHNGHFLNRVELLKRYGASQVTDVDSEAIFRVLDNSNSDKEIADRLSRMYGDFALAFIRKEESNALYLIRNAERTLYAAYIARFRTLLWSSEKSHLRYALARNFLKGSFVEIKSNVLYKISVKRFTDKCHAQKLACVIENPMRRAFAEEDFKIPESPYLYSFEELRYMGYLEDARITEKSKLPCSLCEEQVEAGKLFYDEVSGGSFCEPCSFDYLSEYERSERVKAQAEVSNQQYQLV